MAEEIVAHYSAVAARPMSAFLNPVAMAKNLWTHRELTLQLARRDIALRYRATNLGLIWSVITPLVLLAIYTFVFSVVFKAKWKTAGAAGVADTSHGEFALYLFCGMLLFSLFSEVANRAPSMVLANPNYVKKVVFPLEILPVSALLSALFNMAIGYVAWLCFWFAIRMALPPLTILLLPVVVLPVCLITAGVAWALASLGVFVRDVGHGVALATQALFFVTPIFYGINMVPPAFQYALLANPLTYAVEAVRAVMIEGQLTWEDWVWIGVLMAASIPIAIGGYAFFMKSKRAFADVI